MVTLIRKSGINASKLFLNAPIFDIKLLRWWYFETKSQENEPSEIKVCRIGASTRFKHKYNLCCMLMKWARIAQDWPRIEDSYPKTWNPWDLHALKVNTCLGCFWSKRLSYDRLRSIFFMVFLNFFEMLKKWKTKENRKDSSFLDKE